MKTIRCFYLILFSALAVPAASDAQIADNDASVSVLAVQCAVSSGFSASEYEDYCRRLAKTLSLLSSDQQTRVFGYLPMPGAASLGRSAPKEGAAGSGNTGQAPPETGSTQGGSERNPVESGTNELGNSAAPTESNRVLDLVGKFNSLFDGTASGSVSASTPVVSAGVDASVGTTASSGGSNRPANLGALVSEAATSSNGSASDAVGAVIDANGGGSTKTGNSGSSNGWNSLVAWFEAAEAAYKAGNLSSFLKGRK